MPPSHTDKASPEPAHATVDLESLLGDSDAQLVYEVGPAKFTATSNPAIHSGFCAPAWP